MAQVVGYSEISISEYADGAGLYDSIPYYLASSQSEGVTIYDEGWSREVPVLTPEKKYLWIYYVSRYSAGTTEPEILTVYGNPAVVEYEGDDAPADKVLVEIEPDIAQGMDQTPYIYRAVSDSSVTDLKNHEIISEITGGTVAWNQLIKDEWITSSTTAYGLTITNNGDGTVTINGTVTGKGSLGTPIYAYINSSIGTSFFHCIKDHKYLYLAPKLPDGVSGYNVLSGSTPAMGYEQRNGSAIYNCLQTADTYAFGRLEQIQNGATFNNYKYYFRLIDLTQMFGSTIADYIYSLEQSTAGAGVSLFKSLFPKDYYAYNAGELLSVKTSARETVGKNLLNVTSVTVSSCTFNVDSDGWITAENKTSDPRQWAYANCQWFVTLPKGAYSLDFWRNNIGASTSKAIRVILNDGTFVVNAYDFGESGSLNFSISNATTVGIMTKLYDFSARLQIRRSDAPTDYEPYQKHTYPLSNIELRGIPKLVNNKLTYDGDIYKANGSVTRRFGIVDLGTLVWSYDSGVPRFYSMNLKNQVKNPSANTVKANAICVKYKTVSLDGNDSIYNGTNNSCAISTGGSISIRDESYTGVATFKTAMNGVYLVYELATPTTETANPYTEIQICDADGTEEFIDDRAVAVPVGHKTSYIQAYDDIHMEHWGKNLFELYTRSDSSASGVTWSYQGDSLTARGTATGNSYAMLIENNWMTVEESIFGNLLGKQITVSGGKGGIYMNLAFRKNSSDSGYQTNWVTSGTITVPTDGSYQVYFNARAASGWSGEVTIHPQVELGSTATNYEPYYHENLSFSLGEPVYGGTVDVANYKTTKKYGMIDLGTLTWAKNTDSAFYSTNVTNFARVKTVGQFLYGNAITSKYAFTEASSTPVGTFSLFYNTGYSGNRLFVFDDFSGKTAAEVKAYLSGVYLVYELAEPEESTFQP